MFNLQPFPGKLNYNYKIIKDNWFVCLFVSIFISGGGSRPDASNEGHDQKKVKAQGQKCHWHRAAADVQDEVSHMDENSHKFRRWRNKLCSRRISRLDHRTYRGSLQVGTREAAGRLWWNCRWWDRLATFSKLPNSKTAGLLWKGVPSWRWQIFEVNVRKIFPTHSALSPGLMVMTCACPRKVVYGISLMTSGESPQMIFDVIMSRFPPDYSPNIIYDNACKRVRKNLSCASASLNGNVFANPESFCWLPRRGSSLFEIIWMISHRTYFPLFPSLFFVSSAKNILIQIIFPLPSPFFHPLLKRISSL